MKKALIKIILIILLHNCIFSSNLTLNSYTLAPTSYKKQRTEWISVPWHPAIVAMLDLLKEIPNIPKFKYDDGYKNIKIKWVNGPALDQWIYLTCEPRSPHYIKKDEDFIRQIILWTIDIAKSLITLKNISLKYINQEIQHGDVQLQNLIFDEETKTPVLVDFDDPVQEDHLMLPSLITTALMARLMGSAFKREGIVNAGNLMETMYQQYDQELLNIAASRYDNLETFVKKISNYYSQNFDSNKNISLLKRIFNFFTQSA